MLIRSFLINRLYLIALIITFAISCPAQNKPKKPKEFVDSLLHFPKLVFLVSERAKGKLISIEFENSNCKTLKWKNGILEFNIPENGSLCISNRLSIGLPDEEFYIVGKSGNRKAAQVQEQIFNPELKLLNKNGKEIPVFRFFYGTKELLLETKTLQILETEIQVSLPSSLGFY